MISERSLRAIVIALALLLVGLGWWALSSDEEPVEPRVPTPGPALEHVRPPADLTAPVPLGAPDADPRLGAPLEAPEPGDVDLWVRIVDARGAVVAAANAGVTDAAGRSVFSMRGAESRHEFRDLAPGTWRITTYAVGYLSHELEVELEPQPEPFEVVVRLDAAPLYDVRFLTPTGEDAVRALDALEGVPVRGSDLFAIATRERPDPTLPRMAPGARPQYGLGLYHAAASIPVGDGPIPRPPEGTAGVLELKEPPPVFVSAVLRETVLDTVAVSATSPRTLTFTVVPERVVADLASATVVVLDAETRAPIEGVEITCDDADIAGSGESGARAEDGGRVTFERRYPGWAVLRAWAPGYEVFQSSVELEAGATTDLGTVLLERARSVEGRVVDETGAGVRSVIFARDAGWEPGEGPPSLGHTLGGSGSDGRLVLNRLGPRLYHALAIAPGRATTAFELDLRDGNGEPLEIVLPRGTRTVLASHYAADLTHRVSLYTESGALVYSEALPGRRTRETWLAPGEYELVVRHAERELVRRTIEVTEADAVHPIEP